MNRRTALLGAAAVILMMICMGCTVAMADDPEILGKKMQIYGRISVKGNVPHTYLCLSTESGTDYRLEGGLRDLLWDQHQQETIRLEGLISKRAAGPGHPAEFIVHQIITPDP